MYNLTMDIHRRSPVTVSRVALYDQVWSKPLTKLAPGYGLSDVGLAKVCDRHNIPRPGIGYWMKLEHGKAPPRTPLPPLTDEAGGTIEITSTSDRRLLRIHDVPAIKVSKRLTNPLPFVREIADKLSTAHPDYYQGLITLDHDSQAVKISPTLQGRTVRILDAIGKALESRGGRLEMATNFMRKEYFAAAFDEDAAVFRVRERLREASRTPGTYGDRVTLEPRGELELEIESYAARGLRKRWRDTSRRHLEDHVGAIVATLELVADLERKRRIKFEERQRIDEEKRRKAVELARLEALERARIARLRQLASDWRDANNIRSLVSAVDETQASGREEFIKWALEAAAAMDPTDSPEGLFQLLKDTSLDDQPTSHIEGHAAIQREWRGSKHSWRNNG